MTKDNLLNNITSKELTEWKAFDSVEPIGDTRMDFRFSVLTAVLANAHRDPEKRPEPYSFTDFLPEWWKREEPEATQEKWRGQLTMVEMLNEALGGKDLR